MINTLLSLSLSLWGARKIKSERRQGTLTCSPRLPKGGQRRKGVIPRG